MRISVRVGGFACERRQSGKCGCRNWATTRAVIPNPLLPGDTLYAASRVIEKQDRDEHTGIVRFKLVGVKNERPATLLAAGLDLLGGKFDQKVLEIERSILLSEEFGNQLTPPILAT